MQWSEINNESCDHRRRRIRHSVPRQPERNDNFYGIPKAVKVEYVRSGPRGSIKWMNRDGVRVGGWRRA